MQSRIASLRRVSVIALGVALLGGVAGAEPTDRFGQIFLDVRDTAERRLSEAEAISETTVTGFGRRAQAALAPKKRQLREILADDGASDAQVHRTATRLQVAMDRYTRTVSLRDSVREAMEAARDIANQPPQAGFGRRYQAALEPVADAPRERLADDEATLEQIERVSAELDDALADYQTAQDLRAIARDALASAEFVREYAEAGRAGLDADTAATLDGLTEPVEDVLDDPEATIEQFERHNEALSDELDRIGSGLEERFTSAVNRPSPAFPDDRDADAFEEVNTFTLPVDGWRFQRDRPRLGHHESWYAADLDDSDWRSIEIESFWHELIGERYIGVAWYRTTIDVPELGEYDALGLRFEGVDENGWIWIDGEYAGQHNIGPEGWNRPFQIDVTDLVTPGQTHQITVRVRNSAGAGGIWQPAHVIAYRQREPQ